MAINGQNYTPVDVGDMRDKSALLDAPDGKWLVQLLVSMKPTAEGGFPMLVIDNKLIEAKTEGNEEAAGRSRVRKYIVFFPRNHAGYVMQMRELHALCAAFNVPIPELQKLDNPEDDLAGLIRSLDKAKGIAWTYSVHNKKTNETETKIVYKEPFSARKAGGAAGGTSKLAAAQQGQPSGIKK